MRYFLLFVLILIPIWAEKRIECVGATDEYTAVLTRQGISLKSVNADWKELGEKFRKDRSRLGKLKRKLLGEKPVAWDADVQKLVFMNIPPHLFRDYAIRQLPREKLILFMWEPLMHSRKMYNKNLHDCIGRVYTWDDDLVDNIHYFKFHYPVLTPMLPGIPSFKEKKFCTLISGFHPHKNFAEKYPNELYSERRKAALFFDQVGETGFDLYGRGWDPAIYRTYRGTIPDKLAVLKNYRFSICYENCQHVKGYITEKIFDCFAAGVVPVYWGASNITDYIPKGCFIDRREFATLDELYAFLKQMDESEFNGYLERIAAYLKSDEALVFSRDHFDKLFVEAMVE